MFLLPQEQPPTDNTALSEWLTRMIILLNGELQKTNTSMQVELIAKSTSDQIPSSLDTPQKIVFDDEAIGSFGGLTQSTSGDFVILQDDDFLFEVNLSAGRSSSSSTSYLLFWVEVNGDVRNTPRLFAFVNNKTIEPVFASSVVNLKKGDVLNFWISVDGSGFLDGGLMTFSPSISSIPDVDSAYIQVKRLIEN